jgi:ammonium transporter, Amt family
MFMNGGAGKEIVYVDDYNSPNNIVMNTVIASSTSGLTMVLLNQYTNIFNKEEVVKTTGMLQQNNVFSLCNAIISGIVSITACCNSVSLANAAVIGFFGCLIYH